MFISKMNLGSLVLDVDGNTLQARFLRETGAIDDYFTIIKSETPGGGGMLRLTSVKMDNHDVVLRWNAEPGRSYIVERTADLEQPDWKPISGPLTATEAFMSWIAPASEDRASAYYRVVTSE